MLPAPIPQNENERLCEVFDLQILDTPPESGFDDLALLASIICKVPVALVTIVDSQRQWFKAKVGTNETHTDRSISFCGHAILANDILEIKDTHRDERFVDNPLVTGDLNIRFYAGAPLITRRGHAVGALCVLDHSPRSLSEEQRTALSALASQAVSQLELRRIAVSVLAKAEELEESKRNLAIANAKLVEANGLLQIEHHKSVQNAKLAALGEMSAGIAHEINNPMAIVSGAVQVLRECREDNKKFEAKLLAIESSITRVNKIVLGLRKFSRSSATVEMEKHCIADLIDDALVLCNSKIQKNNVQIQKAIEDSKALTLCNEIEIEQVLINLINNAVDAVKSLEERWIKIELNFIAGKPRLRIINSGPPIPPEVSRKLFQPFFTTKPVGEGTGLGLSISKGILDIHNAKFLLVEDYPSPCFEIQFS